MRDCPQEIADLCDALRRAVKKTLGLDLDYTQETLPILDHYVRSAPYLESPEIRDLVITTAGAYFGEVVRRHLKDGRWHCPTDEHEHWRLECERCFLFFNPLGVALEVLEKEDATGWFPNFNLREADKALVLDRLDLSGEIPSDDYYRFAVRLEVAEHIHGLLLGEAATKTDLAISETDYDEFVRKRLARELN